MELLGQNKIDHHQRQVVILSQDSFYKVLTPEQKAKALKGQFNFDHPGMCTITSTLSQRNQSKKPAACSINQTFYYFSISAPCIWSHA